MERTGVERRHRSMRVSGVPFRDATFRGACCWRQEKRATSGSGSDRVWHRTHPNIPRARAAVRGDPGRARRTRSAPLNHGVRPCEQDARQADGVQGRRRPDGDRETILRRLPAPVLHPRGVL
eukprot:scaffold56798_cov59-Phaeocystis_antarctica.AAC.2